MKANQDEIACDLHQLSASCIHAKLKDRGSAMPCIPSWLTSMHSRNLMKALMKAVMTCYMFAGSSERRTEESGAPGDACKGKGGGRHT